MKLKNLLICLVALALVSAAAIAGKQTFTQNGDVFLAGVDEEGNLDDFFGDFNNTAKLSVRERKGNAKFSLKAYGNVINESGRNQVYKGEFVCDAIENELNYQLAVNLDLDVDGEVDKCKYRVKKTGSAKACAKGQLF